MWIWKSFEKRVSKIEFPKINFVKWILKVNFKSELNVKFKKWIFES